MPKTSQEYCAAGPPHDALERKVMTMTIDTKPELELGAHRQFSLVGARSQGPAIEVQVSSIESDSRGFVYTLTAKSDQGNVTRIAACASDPLGSFELADNGADLELVDVDGLVVGVKERAGATYLELKARLV